MITLVRNRIILLACCAVPLAAGATTYEVDVSHAEIGFSIRHMGISNVRGSFRTFSGTITYDGSDILTLRATAEIEVDSIDTGNGKRDDHLLDHDFFDAAKYPKITFSSTGVKMSPDGHLLTGKLTMHGLTKEISLVMNVSGPIEDPWGNKRIGLELGGGLNRHDFGVGNSGSSDKLLGKNVVLSIGLEGIAVKEGPVTMPVPQK